MDIDSVAIGPALIIAVIGYALGSIPFGLILTRLAGLGDIRKIGSGNIGTTNVLRTGRKDIAAATLALDALKGTAAVLIGSSAGPAGALIGGVAAFVGHLFPVWLRFRGGKGVATYLGILIGLSLPAALAFAAIWASVAALTRYSSASALTASAASPIILLLLGHWAEAAVMAALSAALWFMHRGNIARLLAGTESRIGRKA